MAYRPRVITRSVRAPRYGPRRDHTWHACAPSVSSCVDSSGGVAAGPTRDENGGVRGSGGGGSNSSSAALGDVGERHRSCVDGRSGRRSRAVSPGHLVNHREMSRRLHASRRRLVGALGAEVRLGSVGTQHLRHAHVRLTRTWPCASEDSDRRGSKGGVRWRGSPPPLNPLCCPRAASDSGLRESKMGSAARLHARSDLDARCA